MTDLALSALVRKRAELAGRIEHARAELDAMPASLAAPDAALRLFDPEIRVQAIRPKPFPPVRNHRSPGMRARDVLDALRETGRPMTTREMAAGLLAGQDRGGDEKALSRAGEIVGAALRKLRAKGVASAQPGPGTRALWTLASGWGCDEVACREPASRSDAVGCPV